MSAPPQADGAPAPPGLHDLRSELVATAHGVAAAGLVLAALGNVSGRDGGAVLVSAAGAPLGSLGVDDLVTLALDDGEVLAGTRAPSSERRVHLAIYRARPEAGAIIHTHSTHATAWSFLGEPLRTGSAEFDEPFGGAVETAAPAPAGSDELAASALAALGDRRAVLLPGHGSVALGATPAEALETCLLLERQAEIAWLLRRA